MKRWLFIALIFAASQSRAQTPEIVTQSGHMRAPVALDFAPGGVLLSADYSGQAKLWNAAGSVQRSWSETGALAAVAWSPDGKLFVLAGAKRLAVFEMGRDSPLWEWRGSINEVAFTLNSDAVAASTIEGIVYLWDARSGELRQSFAGSYGGAHIASAGGVLAVGGANVISLYDAATGKVQRELQMASFSGANAQTYLTSLAFSSGGRTLMATQANGDITMQAPSGGRRSRVSVWHVADGTRRCLLDVPHGSGGAALSPDGERIALATLTPGGAGQRPVPGVSFYDARRGALLKKVASPGAPFDNMVFSRDGATLAVVRSEGMVCAGILLLDGRSGAVKRRLATTRPLLPSRFLPGTFLSREHGGALHFWKWPSLRLQGSSPPRATWWTQSAALPDGRLLAARAEEKELSVSEARTGKILWRLPGQAPEGWLLRAVPNGARLLWPRVEHKSGGQTGWLEIFDALTGKKLKSLARVGVICSTALSRDGKSITLCDDRFVIKTLDAATGREMRRVELRGSFDEQGFVYGTGLSPDGGLCSLSGESGGRRFLQVYETRTGNEVFSWSGFAHGLALIAFNEAGSMAALGTEDGTIRIWDKGSREARLSFVAPGGVMGLLLSDDARLLAVGGGDGAVRFFDTQKGALRATLQLLGAKEWIAFTPQGHYDASPGVAPFVRWRVGEQLFPFEKFAAPFHQSQLLEKSLREVTP